MAEPVSIIPQRSSSILGRSDDSDATIVTKDAVVDFNPTVVVPKYAKSRDGGQPNLAASEIHVSFDTSVFESEAEYPVDGELASVIRLDDPKRKGMRLIVSRIDPDELGRINCVCVKE